MTVSSQLNSVDIFKHFKAWLRYLTPLILSISILIA